MPLKAYEAEQPTLNLTPMIDVVFLLIIFFMVGTQFVDQERKIKLQLPSVGHTAALTSAPQRRIVHVLQDGTIQLDEDKLSAEELTSKLISAKSHYPDLSVAVRGDANGPFQYVASVLAACRAAGVEDMAISVRMAN